MVGKTGSGKDSKEINIIAMMDKKLWRAMITHVLKSHVTKKK